MSQSFLSGPYSHCLERNEIRLFKLAASPSRQDGATVLRGRVEVHPIQQCPSYRALSYRWGAMDDKTDPQILLTDGRTPQMAQIPRNLHDYLLTIKLKANSESGWMWIDSICINQNEDDDALQERRRQVACMDQIYASANRVTVWLGAHRGDQDANPVHWLRFFALNQKKFPGLVTHMWEEAGQGHLATIRQNLYWQRLWIIQELCKHEQKLSWVLRRLLSSLGLDQAKNLSILRVRMGDETIKGDALLQLLADHPAEQDAPGLLLANRDQKRSLPELMENYWEWQCSRPRDRVYALLALAYREHSEDLLRITIDYNVHRDILHHELILADANRPWKTFRFSEFLHTRFRDFMPPWDLKRPDFSEDQKSKTCDVIGFYVGCVEKVVDMFGNENEDLGEYASKGLRATGLSLGRRRRELESFREDVQRMQLSRFAELGATATIWTDDEDFKETLYDFWDKREMDRLVEDILSPSQPPHPNNTGSQGSPKAPPHTIQTFPQPIQLNINVQQNPIGIRKDENTTRSKNDNLTGSCDPKASKSPPKRRQWFHIKHPKVSRSSLCLCTGVTFGNVRKGTLVFQFEDSDIALLAHPRREENLDGEWAPYVIMGRAIIARDCCHRPEASKHEVTKKSFSFRALEPGNTEMYPRVYINMTTLSLMRLTKLPEEVRND